MIESLDRLCGELNRIILQGNAPERLPLVQALFEEIRIESKHAIHPGYRLPQSPVRELAGLVDPASQHKNHNVTLAAATLQM